MLAAEENNNWNSNQNQDSNENRDQNQNRNQSQDSNESRPQGKGQNQGQNPYANRDSDSNSGTRDNTAPFEITGNWGKQTTELKRQYPELTDSDLKFEPGKENQLLDNIGTKLNKSRDEVIDIINKCEV